jgi:hypothetical protein
LWRKENSINIWPNFGLARARDVVDDMRQASNPGRVVLRTTSGHPVRDRSWRCRPRSVYEYEDVDGAQFGRARVEQVVLDMHSRAPAAVCAQLRSAVRACGRGAAQEDDIIIVAIRRSPAD